MANRKRSFIKLVSMGALAVGLLVAVSAVSFMTGYERRGRDDYNARYCRNDFWSVSNRNLVWKALNSDPTAGRGSAAQLGAAMAKIVLGDQLKAHDGFAHYTNKGFNELTDEELEELKADFMTNDAKKRLLALERLVRADALMAETVRCTILDQDRMQRWLDNQPIPLEPVDRLY
jgi:hypothetical protein